MSTASISYNSLANAAGEARDVATKLDQYANSINHSVYKKLNSYNGTWTSNLATAKTKANAKITALRNEAERYRSYAEDLVDLKTKCARVDTAVKSSVSRLTADFKRAHGIKNNVVVNVISYVFTSINNSTSIGRWVSDKADAFRSGIDYIKQSIEDWYDYEGGKEYIKGVLIATAEIILGILAFMEGGGPLAVIAAVIMIVNGVVNLVNEWRAYGYADDDPATAKRISDLDTMQDTLRVETDSEFWHNVATGIDVVQLVCAVSKILKDGAKLIKNGYKWATNSLDDISRIRFRDMSFKDVFSGIGSKFDDIKAAFKLDGWSYAKNTVFNIVSNTFTNFKDAYFKFDTNSIKNFLKFTKSLLKDGFTVSVLLENIIGPSLSLGNLATAKIDGNKATVSYDSIKFKEFYNIYKDIKNKVAGSDVFKSENLIDASVLDKLNSLSDIRIAVPEIPIPSIPQLAY